MRTWMIVAGLFAAPVALFGAMVGVDRLFGAPGGGYGYVVRLDLPPADRPVGLPMVHGPQDATRPLVVLDAGHGGKDPGAGTGTVIEKDITLALVLALKDELLSRGGIRVALTREDDRFLILGDRAEIARRLDADLFISVHADSTGTNEQASGASVYTLSAKGSSEMAERLATRENAADIVNGISLARQSPSVGTILVDLSQRETQAMSRQFANLLVREARGRMPLRDQSEQAAAFAVLKAPDLPSVLFETGYISNAGDAARLASTAGRQAFTQVTADAIEVFFARTRRGLREPGFD